MKKKTVKRGTVKKTASRTRRRKKWLTTLDSYQLDGDLDCAIKTLQDIKVEFPEYDSYEIDIKEDWQPGIEGSFRTFDRFEIYGIKTTKKKNEEEK